MVRIPAATYRIQFSLNFRFADARDLVPYLSDLGITDLYASPRFKARRGSSHGYDVADPQRVNSELGTEREFEELTDKLKHYSMGLLLDIVPNHMSASHENPWWMDVLENGPSSRYASYFDIDWHPVTTKAAFLQEDRVLLPVLGDLYGKVLGNFELLLKLDEHGFFVSYYDHRFPLDPKSYAVLLEMAAGNLADSESDVPEDESISQLLEQCRELPPFSSREEVDRNRRAAGSKVIKEQLWKLYHSLPRIRKGVDAALRLANGSRETPASLNLLDQILSEQPYRLAFWKIGLEEINYRRFFDVNELVGLRVEEPEVFLQRHRLILQLVREGRVSGLRIDHVDGLHDPLRYLRQLQASADSSQGTDEPRDSVQNVYTVVEKILGEGEVLPDDWPVSGTTGYDFLNSLNGVFIDPEGFAALEESYAKFVGSAETFADAAYAGNKLAMEVLFAGELRSLGNALGWLAAQDRIARDVPLSELLRLLTEVTACLPVYRTYINGGEHSDQDRRLIECALTRARTRVSSLLVSEDAFSFLRQVLFLEPPEYASHLGNAYLNFVMRWQQLTGPVMAKGLEDTASYVHNALISLNEVGADPLRAALPLGVEAFHRANEYRKQHWPATLNATSTHDTKRGEDVRARINVLSELPEKWKAAFPRWHRWNAAHRKNLGACSSPSLNDEILLYQSMLGAWPASAEEIPAFRDRLKTFAVKAARETKQHTNWINPNPEYESGLVDFIEAILETKEKGRFLADFSSLQDQIAFFGFLNSLSQILLKIASPGVPDFYQGEELWDYNLVDPDNRRPVDFRRRSAILAELKDREHSDPAALHAELLSEWQDGRIKLYVTWKALEVRRAHRHVFEQGGYIPLQAKGRHSENLCAFARHHEGDWILVAVPRLLSRIVDAGSLPLGAKSWGASTIELPVKAPNLWNNIFTGETVKSFKREGKIAIRVSELFEKFPILCARSV